MMNSNLQQMMMQLLTSNNPLFKRAQEMASGRTPQEIQQIALNLCKEKGLDFNQMYQQFQSQFKF